MEKNDSDSSDEEIIDWRKEAAAIINDVKTHVKEIKVADNLRSTSFEIFLNLTTKEDKKYCLRISASGLQVVGDDYDKQNLLSANPEDIFETPYSLLSKISEGFVKSFASELSKQLSHLRS